jgi:hypothetical protein
MNLYIFIKRPKKSALEEFEIQLTEELCISRDLMELL